MQRLDFFELKISAKLEYVIMISLLLRQVTSKWGVAEKDQEDIELAVAEVCTNICIYAYANSEGEMIISCLDYIDRLEIMVFYHGQALAIKESSKVLSTECTLWGHKDGGKGLAQLRGLMDEVEIKTDYGLMLMMTKYKKKESIR